MQIIIPKRYLDVDRIRRVVHTPLFFLAGPIRGGGDWQQKMCLEIARTVPNCLIACPCRWTREHPLQYHFVKGVQDRFGRQLDWERHYLELAGLGKGPGCVIFWLAEEDHTHPHPGPEPYAMDTRGEIGAWRIRMALQDARVVVGAQPGFFGLSQIHRNFEKDLGRQFTIHGSMKTVVRAAADLARK